MTKEFKTIEEQVELLRGRGLLFPEESVSGAKDFLLKNNYYRISGYTLTLRKNDVFYPGVTIDNVMEIYHFDRELRNLILWAIEIIEVNIKSLLAYYSSEKYGCLGYLDAANFTNQETHAAILKKGEKAIENRLKHEAYLQHYVNTRQEPIPLWAYVDIMTISDISLFFSISEYNLQQQVAKEYNLTHNKAHKVLSNYLHGLTIVRNLCAHDSRLYNRIFIQKPDLNRKELSLLRNNSDGIPDNSHLFGYILIIRRMLSKEDFNSFRNRLQLICKSFPYVDMKHYGFPDRWKSIL